MKIVDALESIWNEARRHVLALLALTLILALLAGCAPIANNADESGAKDFWGNDPSACVVPTAGPPPAARPTSDVHAEGTANTWQTRPADVAPGNSWILVGVNVRAQAGEGNVAGINACVPVDVIIHVEAFETDTQLGNGSHSRDYEFETLTPWLHHYVPFDYDPRDPRFQGRPPKYLVSVQAHFVPDVWAGDYTPALMACEITIWGAPVASGTQIPSDGPATCSLTHDQFDRYDQYE